jgi:crotonobetainyl-CoA:carnitine CoA-transferase CaiB-like acyl-CoA transferase
MLAELAPGLVYVSLSAYSHAGPWRDKRGYDTLVQTASGMAIAEQKSAGASRPLHVPVAVLDHATGYLSAAATMRALAARTYGARGRHIRTSLAQTREWLEGLTRVHADALSVAPPDDDAIVASLPAMETAYGSLTFVPPAGDLSLTPPRWAHGPVSPGADLPEWM